jgi:hypothetical protein
MGFCLGEVELLQSPRVDVCAASQQYDLESGLRPADSNL